MKDKLQQKLKSEFETPDIPFGEWAARRGIVTDLPEREKCAVYEAADNVSGRSINKNLKKKVLCIVLPIVAFLAGLAVVLACVLPRPDPINPNPPPIIFGANDAEESGIELNEITERDDIYLYDINSVVKYGTFSKDVLIEDNSRVLLYTIRNSLLSVQNGEGQDGFYVTYRVRLYKYYEFFNLGNYSELNKEVTVNGKTIDYNVVELDNKIIARAKFTVNDYEYFVEAHGYNDVTVLNEQNFLNLLDKILI